MVGDYSKSHKSTSSISSKLRKLYDEGITIRILLLCNNTLEFIIMRGQRREEITCFA